jgi:hypothetical protein
MAIFRNKNNAGIHGLRREIREVTRLLCKAIKKDGKAEPIPLTLSAIICKNAHKPVFAMGTIDDNIIAYYVEEELIVTHNIRERNELEKRFKKLKCEGPYSLVDDYKYG